ncbi:MAG TPA: cobyric acid synthase [Solirubrobacteraceae bacterium]|nr:cobyric acid synthase [Solirubrobacteraceae bacterium]
MPALMIQGCGSDVGKSTLVAGLCRLFTDRGLTVRPFKPQNMSNNAAVTADGGEIGRAQALQAQACRTPATVHMNPVLLKPQSDVGAQLIVLGRMAGTWTARAFQDRKASLLDVAVESFRRLQDEADLVIVEGAGSPAEINLRAADLTNMGLAREAGLPVLVVADIDRGGVFASLFGTLALLDAADQAHVAGFLINKFRGDAGILAPGLTQLDELTGRPTVGVLPYVEDLWLDVEDSLALEAPRPETPAAGGGDTLDVAVIRLRWMSNFTDLDALAGEPGVRVRFTRSPADVERADLVVVPGTKATVEDLERLRRSGLDRAITARASAGAPILGICGGYQLLGERIVDEIESGRGAVEGLGVLPVSTTFAPEKLLRRRRGHCPWLAAAAGGYEIRHGRVERHGGEAVLSAEDGEPDGCRVAMTMGISWHGALEHDEFRRALIGHVAAARGRRWQPGTGSFAAAREARLDVLGDLISDHLDTARLTSLIEHGVPADLPTITTEVRPCCAS